MLNFIVVVLFASQRSNVYFTTMSTSTTAVGAVHQSAANSYDTITKNQSAKGKEDSVTPYRHFNNYVKKMLVGQAAHTGSGNRTLNRGFSVLDLASGRGGDLGKWLFAHVMPPPKGGALRSPNPVKLLEYHGVDVSPECITEAQRRLEMMTQDVPADHKAQLKLNFSVGNCFDAPFWDAAFAPAAEGDLTTKKNWIGAFDVVSVQFALHYGCDSVERVKMIAHNMAKVVSPKGGILIATIVDAEELETRRQKGELKTSLYDIKIVSKDNEEDADGEKKEKPLTLGQPYHFFLEGHVDNIEYVIPYSFLKECLEAEGLVESPLCLNQGFRALIPDYEGDFKVKKQLKGKSLSQDEKELVSLYRSVCFTKP
jgi:mRNA (guanine-N7-)-methyltransferase